MNDYLCCNGVKWLGLSFTHSSLSLAMNWQPVGTSLARHWPMGEKWIGPIKEAIGAPTRRHSLTIHWPNQVMLSGQFLNNGLADGIDDCSHDVFVVLQQHAPS